MKFIILTLSWLFFPFVSFSDSPLTSTYFADLYTEAIVQKAIDANHNLTDELAEYLTDKKQPLEIKMAIINALGWNFNGQDNSGKFFQYLKGKNKKYKNLDTFKRKGKHFELICFAYLRAMDDYFTVETAVSFANAAEQKNKHKSKCLFMISGLIKAQKAMESDWCEVYRSVDRARQDETLENDISEKTVENIFEYINLYRDDCAGRD